MMIRYPVGLVNVSAGDPLSLADLKVPADGVGDLLGNGVPHAVFSLVNGPLYHSDQCPVAKQTPSEVFSLKG
ncbi:hypothetical protein GCM10025772_06180 [Ferrimonas gelatinilytica]|uniref:Uncharacterized protein n=1 Tax=Ferrimonas gelatinilytica TaxID=1255257 RepID=A0ABP9RV50_9GAMM